jgi:hypothetical protein
MGNAALQRTVGAVTRVAVDSPNAAIMFAASPVQLASMEAAASKNNAVVPPAVRKDKSVSTHKLAAAAKSNVPR